MMRLKPQDLGGWLAGPAQPDPETRGAGWLAPARVLIALYPNPRAKKYNPGGHWLGECSALGEGPVLPPPPQYMPRGALASPRVGGLASPEFGFPLSPTASHTSAPLTSVYSRSFPLTTPAFFSLSPTPSLGGRITKFSSRTMERRWLCWTLSISRSGKSRRARELGRAVAEHEAKNAKKTNRRGKTTGKKFFFLNFLGATFWLHYLNFFLRTQTTRGFQCVFFFSPSAGPIYLF
jgi:hypothetical protein